MSKIKDKVVFITGASSGIGEATAEILAEKGAKVIVTARREDRLKNLTEKINNNGGTAELIKLDVVDKDAFKKAVDYTIDKYGRLDVIFNNAGLMPLSMMENLHTEEWERMIDVNIKGVLNGVAASLPYFKKQNSGHIINTSSIAGHKVFPGGAVYCATKFAVKTLSEGLRDELSKTNIKVSTVSPGAVATELTYTITDEVIKEKFANRKSFMKPLESEDIANAVVYALEQPDNVDINDIIIRPVNSNL